MYLVFVQKIALFIRSLVLIHPNKMAERKHRHILDVTRTLMIHMSVSKYLWSDDLLSACYLINRIHSLFSIKDLHFLVSMLIKPSSP